MRKLKFQNNKYYHIFNRGVEKRNIFLNNNDYARFLQSIKEFNTKERIGSLFLKYYEDKKKRNLEESSSSKFEELDSSRLVNIICYCCNPNHFHFLLNQKVNQGISRFMQKLGTGYTNYFNAKYERVGPLFQGQFKAIEIKTEEKLLEISMYVNGNHEIHGLGSAKNWPWSSCRDCLGLRDGRLSNKKRILNEFSSVHEYEKELLQYIKNKKQWKSENKELFLE